MPWIVKDILVDDSESVKAIVLAISLETRSTSFDNLA